MILVALIYGYFWEDQRHQDETAERVVAGISPQDEIGGAEAKDWRELAKLNWRARLNAVKTVLSAASIASKFKEKGELLIHVVISLDSNGDLSRQLIEEIIVPALRQPGADSTVSVEAGKLASYLRLSESVAVDLAAALVARMTSAQPNETQMVADLTKVLVLASEKLSAKDIKKIAAALLAQMSVPSTDTELEAKFGEALGGLSNKIESKDLETGAGVLVSRLKSLQPSDVLLTVKLAEALGSFKDKLTSDAAQEAETVLVTRMASARWDESAVWEIADSLDYLKERLNPDDARRLAAVLADRMTNARPNEGELVAALGRAVGLLQEKFEEREEAMRAATTLVYRMKCAKPNENRLVADLGIALSWLKDRLDERDAILLEGARVLTDRMKDGQVISSRLFVRFAVALGNLRSKLSAEDVLPGIVAYVERITSPQAEGDADSMFEINDRQAIEQFTSKIRSENALPLAESVVHKITSTTTDHEILLLVLLPTLKSLAGSLVSLDKQRLAADLVARIGSLQPEDWRDKEFLGRFGEASISLTEQLSPADAQKLATVVVERMTSVHEGD